MKNIKSYDKFNESIRDLMKPKSEEEIDDAFENVAEKVADILVDKYDYDDYLDAYEWAESHKEKIMEMIDDDTEYDLDDIIYKILYGWEGAIDESIRDLMKPKSEEEIKKAIDNYFLDHSYYQLDMKEDVLDAIKKELSIKRKSYDIHMTPWDIELLKQYVINDFKFDYELNDFSSYKNVINNTLDKLMRKYNLIIKHNIKRFNDRHKLEANESIRDLMKPIPKEEIDELRKKGIVYSETYDNPDGYTEKKAKSIIKLYSKELNSNFRCDNNTNFEWVYKWMPTDKSIRLSLLKDEDKYFIYMFDHKKYSLKKFKSFFIPSNNSSFNNSSFRLFKKVYYYLEDALTFLSSCNIDVSKITKK